LVISTADGSQILITGHSQVHIRRSHSLRLCGYIYQGTIDITSIRI
jgi:hypothetical protein